MRCYRPGRSASGTTLATIGGGALAVTTTTSESGVPVWLITTHLKSKLLTYPGGRFFPHNEDERARYGDYALARRGGEAVAFASPSPKPSLGTATRTP
jgi:hypothetical protein